MTAAYPRDMVGYGAKPPHARDHPLGRRADYHAAAGIIAEPPMLD